MEQTELQLCEQLRRAHVICLVYSVEDDDTLLRVTSYWLPFIRDQLSHSQRRPPVVLVGNKVDLVEYSTVDVSCVNKSNQISPYFVSYTCTLSAVDCQVKSNIWLPGVEVTHSKIVFQVATFSI